MAIVQSKWGKGLKQTPYPDCSGDVVAERFSITIGANIALNDIIEMGVLPANCTVLDATLITDEVGTATFDVGLMSGTVGSTDDARTCGNELFVGATDAATTRMSKAAGFRIATTAEDRSLGVKVLTAGITAASQVIDLIVYYVDRTN